jgi:hypothetical protein
MKTRLLSICRTVAPALLVLSFASLAGAQIQGTGLGSGNAGLDRAFQYGQTLLTWLRDIAFLVFIGALVWGCIESAVESWREGRGKVFTAIGCAIIAGIAQGLISGIYSTNG